MHQCDKHDADLTIDNVHYKLETFAEIKQLSKLAGSSGVVFVSRADTWLRLESAHKEMLRVARQTLRATGTNMPKSGRA